MVMSASKPTTKLVASTEKPVMEFQSVLTCYYYYYYCYNLFYYHYYHYYYYYY